MDPLQIRADRTQPALAHGAALPWVPSPEVGVERRMLERSGGEVAIATSIVRYAAGSRFRSHAHGLGEEFLVLEGTFSDQHGHYPAGTYVRNPPGSAHAPFSDPGCTIFVKLRQMADDEPELLRVFPGQRVWEAMAAAGCAQAVLYENLRIRVTLLQMQPGAVLPPWRPRGGVEGLLVSGEIALGEGEALTAWDWWRQPAGMSAPILARSAALLWLKQGHLP
ncbi:MAG TPA: cupin domain-containing protein [bacterium]